MFPMDDIPICPPWWPVLNWQLHFLPRPWPGPGPVNLPAAMEDIYASLNVHTMSYLLLDQKAAAEIRANTEQRLIETIGKLSRMHDEATRNQLTTR
jgi:hypothetical protein